MSKRLQVMQSLKNSNNKITDSASIIGKLWKSLSEEEKKPFFILSEQDRKRFEKEKSELEKLGYFTD
jgi:hypothetical protein